MNAAAGRGGEEPVAEDRQVEHRRRAAVLDEDEERQQDGRGGEADDHDRVVPARQPALRDPEDEPGEPGDEGRRAEQVEAALGVGLRQLAQDEPAPERRRASPSGTLNQKTQCHEIATRAPPSTGPITRPTAATIVLVPIASPSCSRREGVGDQRGGVREQEGAADALHDPPQDQLGAVRREAGAERGEREDEKAADVGLLAPEEVGEAARP